MVKTIATSIAAFCSTNVDNIFILMLLYAQATGAKERRQIVIGQYLGIGVLTGLSILCALSIRILPGRIICWLGLIPIFLGIRAWVTYRKEGSGDTPEKRPSAGAVSVMTLTIANGADNLGMYIPIFSSYTAVELLTTILVFLFMTALWCLAGYYLSKLPSVRNHIQKYAHIIVPTALIGLGIYIILNGFLGG